MPNATTIDALHSAASTEAALFLRQDVLLFSAEGPDLERYLQGRITQDVKSLAAGSAAPSLVLSPQGKVQGHFTLLKLEQNQLLLIADKTEADSAAEDFLKALLQFKVADQLSVTEAPELKLASVIGPNAKGCLQALSQGALPSSPLTHQKFELNGETLHCLRREETLSGFDLLYPQSVEQALIEALLAQGVTNSSSEISTSTWSLLRVSAGIPHQDSELGEKTSATEIPYKSLISFSKGCYAGQEVVEMSIARGRPNKELVVLQADANAGIKVGDAIVDQESGKECGTITSVCKIPPEGTIAALGFVKAKFLEKQSFLVAENLVQRQSAQ